MSESQSEIAENSSSEPQRYRLLSEIIDAVARTGNLTEAFHRLAAPVLELTGGELLNLSLHSPYRDRMLTRYWKKNGDSGEFDAFAVDEVATGWAWKHQQPIAIPDIECDPRFSAIAPVLRNHGVRSYTVVPMSTRSSRFGALAVGKGVTEALPQEEIEFLSRIALMGAQALEKEAAQGSLEEQQSLFAISRELSLSLQSVNLLPVILSSVRNIARYERAVLCLLDEGGKTLHRYGELLEWETESHEDAIPIEQSLAARTIQTRSVVLLSAAELRGMDDFLAQAMYASGVRSVCSVPLIAGNRVWGALHPSSVLENAFGPKEIEYLEQVANQIATALQNAAAYRQITRHDDRLTQEKHSADPELPTSEPNDEIVGSSPALKRILDYAAIVAATDATVLITGETGTGKERIARLIHEMSRRRDRRFINLNCAAIPTGLLESELFGHEKGAFTGAVSQKIGRLELADKGTLLLDEVGEIPLELQPKLLRVLQDQEFERLGGTKTIRVDARLIAATNRDLARAVEEKEFRSDLFYRLHVFPLHLPALRDRRDDIPALIRHFVEKCSARMHKRINIIPDDAVQAMVRWSWPGNIRELENFIERSVILSDGNRLRAPLGELREELMRQVSEPISTLADRERAHIIEILRQTRGALSGPGGAAARLGVKRTTLQYKMQRLGISRTDYLS
jgi:formate hydrogenlyase transcriptional activator